MSSLSTSSPTSNPAGKPARKGITMGKLAAVLLPVFIGGPLLVAYAADAGETVDPLTCYIATDGPSVEPESVSLACGGGVDALVDLSLAKPSYEPSLSLGDAEITRAAVGTSTSGSAIVRLWVDSNDQTCVYYRDLANAPQDTDITCSDA